METVIQSRRTWLVVLLVIVAVVGGLVAFSTLSSTAEAQVAGPSREPGSPMAPERPIVGLQSGVVGLGECFVTTQKSLEGPVLATEDTLEGPFLQEMEIIKVISACNGGPFFVGMCEDMLCGGWLPGVNFVFSNIETFTVSCRKDPQLRDANCFTERVYGTEVTIPR